MSTSNVTTLKKDVGKEAFGQKKAKSGPDPLQQEGKLGIGSVQLILCQKTHQHFGVMTALHDITLHFIKLQNVIQYD